jgi:hypothetical protein
VTTHVPPQAPSGAAPSTALIQVDLAGGQTIQVQTPEEAVWFEGTRDKYRSQNRYTDVTDIQDLDQLLVLELMVHRWTLWTTSGRDYDSNLISEDAYIKPLREYANTIGALKSRMGLARAEREKEQHESVGAYLVELQRRAKEFGIHRESQLGKALELVNQLSALLGAFDRADEEEREAIGLQTDNDILDWVRQVMLPEFRAIDDHFRNNQQKFWAGTL